MSTSTPPYPYWNGGSTDRIWVRTTMGQVACFGGKKKIYEHWTLLLPLFFGTDYFERRWLSISQHFVRHLSAEIYGMKDKRCVLCFFFFIPSYFLRFDFAPSPTRQIYGRRAAAQNLFFFFPLRDSTRIFFFHPLACAENQRRHSRVLSKLSSSNRGV